MGWGVYACLAALTSAHTHHNHDALDRALGAVMTNARASPVLAAKPFALSDVRLDSGAFSEAQARDLEYAVGLDPVALTCIFTSAANLSHCPDCPAAGDNSRPTCNPLPGEMGLGAYYGHYLGHWLSAQAFLWNGTKDERTRVVSRNVISLLKDCQRRWGDKYPGLHDGYIFPYDPVVFDMLEEKLPWGSVAGRREYSVPFYTYHKVMAGLLDQHTHAQSSEALQMVRGMADWVVRNVKATFARGGQGLWQRVLGTEWGGMNDVLFNLYTVTGEKTYLQTAYAFNHWDWSAPLAAGVDDLDGNHANTHIPEVIGNQRGYEITGNLTDRAVAVEFFAAVTKNHSFVTGGSNDHEHWGAPRRMGDQLNADTEESCTQYNILKVSRHLFQWTADATLADFYERAMWNGIIGNQNKEDPNMTQYIYMLPLGGGGIRKPWGRSDFAFPCCWGTLTEQFAKMGDSIYFASPDDSVVYVTQFVSSMLSWRARGVNITQATDFPQSGKTSLTIDAPLSGASFTLAVRIPGWATGSRSVKVNGVPVAMKPAGTFLTVEKLWRGTNKVAIDFEMLFSASKLNDDRAEWSAVYAYTYGPLVLAGLTDDDTFTPPPGQSVQKPSGYIKRNSTDTLDFEATGGRGLGLNQSVTIRMVPLFEVMSEAYTVYYHTQGRSVVPYAPGGATVGSAQPDMVMTGDVSFNGGPQDANCSGVNLRTGNTGTVSYVTLPPVHAPGHSLSSVQFGFRYSAGYTPPAGVQKNASVVTVQLVWAVNNSLISSIWTSSPLGNYSYDDFTRYSPVIEETITNIDVPNDDLISVRFEFQNQERNLQIPIDNLAGYWNVRVGWK
eukprot:Hpha_TRINITY_DN15377_c2_g13::TRINITY_DN15377_c2_g13_i1::g.88518::m.88518/K09955/K09955; uncharacterized protein